MTTEFDSPRIRGERLGRRVGVGWGRGHTSGVGEGEVNAASKVVPVASSRSFLCVRSGHLQELRIQEWSGGVLGEVPKKSWALGVAQRGDWKVMC